MILVFLILVLVAALLLYAVIMAGALTSTAKRGRVRNAGGARRGSVSRDEVATRWATIEAMAAGGGNGLRQAISEADKLFDHVLASQGVRGETMGERLKSARPRFSDYSVYDAIWRAHKLRNALAHEVGFDLVASQAQGALGDFKRGLRELGVL